MRNVVRAAMRCRRCSCRAVYAGPLDVKPSAECDECHHRLAGDHELSVDGIADPEKQFRAVA